MSLNIKTIGTFSATEPAFIFSSREVQGMFDVIIPAYNCEVSYLRAAIESVLNQTYQEFEIYISEGTSPEDNRHSERVLAHYNDPRIHIIQQIGVGISDARNQALRQGTNPYVCTLDSDDTWEPQKLEYYKQQIDAFPTLKMMWGAAKMETGGVDYRAGYFEEWEQTRPEHKWLRLYWSPLMTSTILYHRDSLVKFGGWNEFMTMGEDTMLNLKFLFHYPQECVQCPAYVGTYRKHSTQTTAGSESGHSHKNPSVIPNSRRFTFERMFAALQDSTPFNPTPYWNNYWKWLEQVIQNYRQSSNIEGEKNKRTSPLSILQRVDGFPNGTLFKETPQELGDLLSAKGHIVSEGSIE